MIKNVWLRGNDCGAETLTHVGCVVDVVETVERRNHSWTMDYSDIRQTNCTYAIVWTGDCDVPPWEQFKRIDCTSMNGDLVTVHRYPEKTAHREAINPVMWTNYITFKAVKEAEIAAEREAENKAAEVAAAYRDAKEAKKAASAAKAKAIAEVELAQLPEKGTELRNGMVVFWKGTTVYRKKTHARIGAKPKGGEAVWFSLQQLNERNLLG